MQTIRGSMLFLLCAIGSAQDFNLDVGSSLGTPAPSFAGAAGQPGFWQSITANVPFGPQPLLDVNGNLTSVTLAITPGPIGYNGVGSLAWNNPSTSGDLQALFDDGIDVGGGIPFGFSGIVLTLNGLAADHYDIYTYAFAPNNYLPANNGLAWNSVVGIQGTIPPQLWSGCVNWPGGMYAALNYTRHTLFVASGSPLQISIDSDVLSGGFASFNGLQIVKSTVGCQAVGSYCTELVSSSGCRPKLGAAGYPSFTNPSLFQLVASNLENNKSGLLFFGTTGPNAAPFLGGVLCVKAPLHRLPVKTTGGASACLGLLSYSLSDFLAHPNIGSMLSVGTLIHSQAWFRDPPAIQTVGLTNALQFFICP